MQFVELKGSVFKKFDKSNLFQVACSDVRERFHLFILLLVVVIQTMKEYGFREGNIWKSISNIESDKKQEFEHLIDETSFMKDVKSLQDLQKVIKTNQFWADAWAVSTIERIYNVKFIILSKKHFLENEIDNVMQCGVK